MGSLLLEMQKQEEELRSRKDAESFQAINLDAGSSSKKKKDKVKKLQRRQRKKSQESVEAMAEDSSNSEDDNAAMDSEDLEDDYDDYEDDFSLTRESLSTMDSATAQELDKSVTWMVSTPTARDELVESVGSTVPLPSLYASSPLYTTSDTKSNNTNKTDTIFQQQQQEAPLRMSGHYFDRISRDMRHLAVSIASSIEDVDQWRTFCQEGNGGLMPLLECIREGARYIALQKQFLAKKKAFSAEGGMFLEQQEETFMAACSACRALRDLCAISPELSAVITDGILRANAAWSVKTESTNHRSQEFNNYRDEGGHQGREVHQYGENLMHDFMTMLRYANEYSEPTNRRRKTSSNPFQRNRNRRGKPAMMKFTVLI